MSRRVKVQLNRVEGDLELELEVDQGVVTNAWCIGTMYRGFEQILIGRAAMDSLAITPRICGICSTAHLYASVLALESMSHITPPPNAIRVRNICLLAEEIQSDCRQTFLMFTPDLCHPNYSKLKLYDEIKAQFEDMTGNIYQDAVRFSRDIIEIVAIFGGQWPHSSYMVPGGVTSLPDTNKVISALSIVDNYIHWLETKVLGIAIEQWNQIDSLEKLNDHSLTNNSSASLLYQFGKRIALNQIGQGCNMLMSYGSIIDPTNPENTLRKRGIYNAARQSFETLDQEHITEDISYSWYHDDTTDPRHPKDGLTQPKYDPDSERYSWAKAPRYKGQVIQTGPLAQLVVDKNPLLLDMLEKQGGNTLLRQFARIQRQVSSITLLKEQLQDLLANISEPTMVHQPLLDGEGIGMIEAARGSLGHWVRVENGTISGYQVITPTAWNASPRDQEQQPGHIESSLIGLDIPDTDDPLTIGHVVRSHDPCLVCTVHVLGSDKKHRYGVI
ncbi:nickel-dependent hydrogenase large subunit [Neptuniibacter sp. PT8_73]|uniref:nickel-dependent hydrogenase large subunit n=1 Tax=unclassified Neptuniibacter TaxID=2630693 RepID=UPI0039F6EB12